MMDLSVIIPVFNRPESVLRAIESVRQASKKSSLKTEVWVCDDGSTDTTVNAVRAMGGCEVLCLPHRGDPGWVRNQGVAVSRGRYLAFLDSDDFWSAERILHLEDLLRAHPDFEVSLCPEFWPDGGFEPGFSWLKQYLNLNLGRTSSLVISRSLFEGLGGFPEGYFGEKQMPTPGFEDYELILKALGFLEKTGKKSAIQMLPPEDVVVKHAPGGIGRRSIRDQMLRESRTLVRAGPKIPPQCWGIIARRWLGAAKVRILGR